ncbi:MAG: hypothetical protein KDA80_21120 [Planctomycetaceae bacterium]|nr:hypothetical protein [Planctomycetaceae bacterium]
MTAMNSPVGLQFLEGLCDDLREQALVVPRPRPAFTDSLEKYLSKVSFLGVLIATWSGAVLTLLTLQSQM